jgi:hypothetical protein
VEKKDILPERQLPGSFASRIEKDMWGKIEKQFFINSLNLSIKKVNQTNKYEVLH